MSELDPMHPESYPRRILLAVTGLSPQVVTETLYALAVSGRPAFVPTEIHLITTAQGREHARLNLLSHDPGWFHRLRADYGLPAIAFDADHIHVLTDVTGAPLTDIRTPEENELAADFICSVVSGLTREDNAALHVSLAGGRKTMGYYLGYALSLFGRPQDRLSHVLVSAPFESHPQFYYPTPREAIIHTLDREQRPLDCREAVVTLARIPLVRLREGLPERLLQGKARFTEAVEAANRGLAPPRLVLDLAKKAAFADGEPIALGTTEMAVLLWLARRALRDDPEVDWSRPEEAEEFIQHARELMNSMGGEFGRLSEALAWRMDDRKALGEYFEPQKSRINKAFVKALGERAAERYLIRRSGPRGASRYSLPLAAEQIEILE